MRDAVALTVPGKFSEVARIRGWLHEVLSSWGISAATISDIRLAVTEVCTNIVRHGYKDGRRGEIAVQVSKANGGICLTISDTAPVFIPRAPQVPPPESLGEGGYGLFLVRSLMDEVSHEATGETGNRVTLMKYER